MLVAELATRPIERERPERYVVDVQISAGYMHSGYPIMTHDDVAAALVDLEKLMHQGHGGVWGFYHELGHNHQSRDWTFDGTSEVTVNLFTLYVFDRVCGTPPRETRDVLGARRQTVVQKYRDSGSSFAQWKSDPFPGANHVRATAGGVWLGSVPESVCRVSRPRNRRNVPERTRRNEISGLCVFPVRLDATWDRSSNRGECLRLPRPGVSSESSRSGRRRKRWRAIEDEPVFAAQSSLRITAVMSSRSPVSVEKARNRR